MHTANALLDMIATDAVYGDARDETLVRPIAPMSTPDVKEVSTFQFNAELVELPDGTLVWMG
jgi:hypothetical protein